MKKLAVLISNAGTGTNLQAIIDTIETGKLKAKIVVIISSSPDAYGLERAKKHHIQTIIVNKNDNLKNILTKTYQVDLVILAGWKFQIKNPAKAPAKTIASKATSVW